jgi:hypothetical protein
MQVAGLAAAEYIAEGVDDEADDDTVESPDNVFQQVKLAWSLNHTNLTIARFRHVETRTLCSVNYLQLPYKAWGCILLSVGNTQPLGVRRSLILWLDGFGMIKLRC